MSFVFQLIYFLLILASVISADDNGFSRQEILELVAKVKTLEEFAASQVRLNNELGEKLVRQDALIEDMKSNLKELQVEENGPRLKPQKQGETSERIREDTGVRLRAPRQAGETIVAFSAIMTQRHEDNIGVHQNIIFEDVETNMGAGYNSHTGIFTAPVSGLYLISAAIVSRHNREYSAAIVVNRRDVARLNGRGTDGRHGSGSQTVIISLRIGDAVAVQNLYRVNSYWGDKYSSFSGFLIQ